MIELAWLIPLFPVIGVVVNGFFGHSYTREKAGLIASLMAGFSFLVVLGIASEMIFGAGGKHTIHLWTWIEAGKFSVSVAFLIDPLSTIMLLVVSGVGFLVHVYSVGYMQGDPGYPRFFTYMNLFMLSMFLLVLGDNYLLMFVGWEGVGLCSMETMGEAVVERLAATGRYDLLIKLHDHPKNKKIDWRQRLGCFEDAHCRVVSDLDVTPLLALANLLISDASSVSNEYALLDRPMVFLDVPKLLARARERAGSMLDLDTWGRKGGVIVDGPEQVVDAVDEGLERPETQSDVRRRTRDNLFYNPGCATDAAMSWLGENLLTGAPSRAAAAVSAP